MIICLEGLDGCGKGTQATRLLRALRSKDFNAHSVKFPDYTTITGRLIEKWIHGGVQLEILENPGSSTSRHAQALAFQALMTANRVEKVEMLRRAQLESYLICDRYWQSGVAYGAGIDGLSYEHMTNLRHCCPQADLNILIDVPVTVALERQAARGRKDTYEGRETAMVNCRFTYSRLWREMKTIAPGSWPIVDGTQPEEFVASEILRLVRTAESR